MFIAANFLGAVSTILDIVLTALYWVVLIRALISWVNPDPNNAIVRMLHDITEPLLTPIRKMLPFSLKMTMDISPLIAFLVIIFLKSFLVQTLRDIAFRMRMG
jgi:YggT family protein